MRNLRASDVVRYAALGSLVGTLGLVDTFLFVHPGCSGCSASSGPPVAVNPIVVTNGQCAVFELEDDAGVTRAMCLTAKQLRRAIEDP